MYSYIQHQIPVFHLYLRRVVYLLKNPFFSIATLTGITIGVGVVFLSNPVYTLIGLLAVILFAGAVFSVEFGLLAMVFILYTRLSDIAVHVHNGPSIAQSFIVLLILAIIVRWSIFHEKPEGWAKLAIILCLYGLVGFTSIVYAENLTRVLTGLSYFARDAIIAILVVILLQNMKDFKRVIWVLIIVGIFLGTLSTYQFLTGSFTNNFGGFANARIMQILGETNDYRIGGPIGDPNYFAQIMVVIAPLALERLNHDSKPSHRFLALWALVVIILSIMFTYSRGGLLALLVTIGLYYMIHPPRLAQIPILIVAIVIFLSFAPDKYLDRIFSLNQLFSSSDLLKVDDSALRSRVNENLAAWEMIKSNPLFGVGLGNYATAYAEYSRELGVAVIGIDGIAAHNLYLEVLAETGIIGLTIFLSLIYFALNSIYQAYKSFNNKKFKDLSRLISGFGLGIIGYLTAASFIHGAYPRYFYLLLGIGISLEIIVLKIRGLSIKEQNQLHY